MNEKREPQQPNVSHSRLDLSSSTSYCTFKLDSSCWRLLECLAKCNLVIGHIKCSLGKCKSLDPMIKVQCLLVSSTITLQAVLPFALLHPTSLDVFHEIIITCFFYKKSGQSHDGVDFPSLLCLIVVYVNTTGALFHFPHRLEQISRIIVIQEYVVNLIWCPRFVSIPFTTWSTEINNTECPIHHLSFSFL